MAVRVITVDAFAEPKDFVDAKEISEVRFDLRLRELRVAVPIEQTRFAGEQGTRAVHIDRATFKNHARVKNRDLENFCDTSWYDLIEIAGRILASPGIVIPIDDGQSRVVFSRHKNWPVIAAPRFVRRDATESDSGMIQITKNRHGFGLMRAIAYIDKNRFGLDERVDYCPKNRQNTIKTAWKTNRLATWPRKPGRLVRFPFRRHAVAELGRCLVQIDRHGKATALTETSADQSALGEFLR